MATSVDICNEALVAFGQEPIMTLDESSKSARRCKQLYDSTRQYLLSLHPWSFALQSINLAPTEDYHSTQWQYAFRRPSDCLKIVRMSVPNSQYTIEDKYICCNDDSLTLLYVKDLEDVNQFSRPFYACCVKALAKALIPSLAENYQHQAQVEKEYAEALREARHFDSVEQQKLEYFRDDWILARYM